jgi:hypothetical protein
MSNEINNNSTKFNYRLIFKQQSTNRFAKFILTRACLEFYLELNQIIDVLHNIK